MAMVGLVVVRIEVMVGRHDATRRLRSDVYAADWLHSMVYHGCSAVAMRGCTSGTC